MQDPRDEPLPLNLSHEYNSGDRPADARDRTADLANRKDPAKPAQRRNTAIVVVPVLLVLVTFLFWYQTWWGRRLSEGEMRQCLNDTSAPHKTQHALSQLAQQIARGDPAARQWYPLVLRLASNKEAQLRLMTAWVMGQDTQSADFHQMLLQLLRDPEAMVRWNAALALVRFSDATGEPELHFMLRPYGLLAPQLGTVVFRLKEQEAVSAGSLVARINGDNRKVTEVRSPLAGRLERWVAKDGAQVETGQEIATISPGWEQVWEALRALYLVGKPADLNDVERFAAGVAGEPRGVQQQAVLAAQAIRSRNSRPSTVDSPQ
jgi:Biotin-lipoyl like/HEAT repeat